MLKSLKPKPINFNFFILFCILQHSGRVNKSTEKTVFKKGKNLSEKRYGRFTQNVRIFL